MSLTGSGGAKVLSRTSTQLYRDCLRLVNHVAGKSKKGYQLRRIVGGEFRKNAKVTDSDQITLLKTNAIRALANYLMIESTSRDVRFKDKAAEYTAREASSLQTTQEPVDNPLSHK